MGSENKNIIQRPIDQTALASLSNQHPLLSRIYAARGICDESELDLGLSSLLPFHDLKGIEQAVEVIYAALSQQQKLLVVGDFDADGATSSALAVRALRAMGAADADYLVPNRFEFGYGLTPEIVEIAKQRQPDLIITVDNGISSLEGVVAAKAAGIKVVVTDHHLAGNELPLADAIINPNQPDCGFAAKSTAGVGVIFYLMVALRTKLRALDWFQSQGIKEPNMAEYLDLVALGTVADVVPLERNNRILVKQGLNRIRAGKSVPGIRALLEISGRDRNNLVAGDLGFALGPRLNAAGRLDDMSLGIECLLTDDESAAFAMARQLDELNRARKEIEADMKQQALESLSRLDVAADRVGLCLYDADWHQGVIGILASRIKDRFHRPVIAFADAGDNEIKGSARSIKGFHIRDALDTLAKSYPNLLQKFGGHAMAAGLSIEKKHFEQFSAAFDQIAQQTLAPEQLEAEILTDGSLEAESFSMDIAQLIINAGPWGQQFPEPQFEGEFDIIEQRLVGEQHLKLKLASEQGGRALDAIAFFIDLEQWPNPAKRLRLVYRLDINEFRGARSLQLMVEHLEPL